MSPTALPSHTLAAEKQLALQLVDILKQEQNWLSTNRGEAILAIVSKKTEMIAAMTSLAKQRHQLLRQTNANNMQAWLEQHGAPIDQQLWHELSELAQSAQEMNRVNGLLLNRQIAYNQTLLSALQGTQVFYGASGHYCQP